MMTAGKNSRENVHKKITKKSCNAVCCTTGIFFLSCVSWSFILMWILVMMLLPPLLFILLFYYPFWLAGKGKTVSSFLWKDRKMLSYLNSDCYASTNVFRWSWDEPSHIYTYTVPCKLVVLSERNTYKILTAHFTYSFVYSSWRKPGFVPIYRYSSSSKYDEILLDGK